MGSSARAGARSAWGFTVVELLITLAVIGILAAVALPSYTRYAVRANRSAAESFMLEVSSRQERYLVDARAYAPDLATLGMTAPDTVSPNYNVTIINVTATPPGYTVQAVPIGSQLAKDTDCGTLTITGGGVKAATGTSGSVICWSR
jgi:type IV pilus assembly protein PilE